MYNYFPRFLLFPNANFFFVKGANVNNNVRIIGLKENFLINYSCIITIFFAVSNSFEVGRLIISIMIFQIK